MRGEGGGGGCEILFRFVSVPDKCTTIEILFLFSFYKIKKKWLEGWVFSGGRVIPQSRVIFWG